MRRFSVSRNNCRSYIGLKHKQYELSHRQIVVILPYDLLTDIESSEYKIERKVKPGFIPCLLPLKSGELLCVAYAELNRKASTVETYNPDSLYTGISGKVKKGFAVLDRARYNAYVPFQRP